MEKSNGKPNNLWKGVDLIKYQLYVTISSADSNTKPEENDEIDDKVVYIEDLEKRKEVYGICGECNEPGTGAHWCQPCNAKRFKDNFKNWTSGNKDIDELIQHSQLNAVHFKQCLHWIPFENFQNVTYITRGGFGKIHSADWPEGYIKQWDIVNQKWDRHLDFKFVLKSLDNSSSISTDFLNEVKSYLQIYNYDIIMCFGLTQDPNTKDYMMVLNYCDGRDLRNYLNQYQYDTAYETKIHYLLQMASGLQDIHNAEKVHKDFHSGNILFDYDGYIFISDLGMCQPVNNKDSKKGVYGVLPYMAPEVLRGYQYTKAADIYSFGIVMNEFMSEETPYNDIPHNYLLAVKICKGLRPKISEDVPKLLADLIMKCWDAKIENRPTAKELHQILKKLDEEIFNEDGEILIFNEDSEIYFQFKEYEKSRKNKVKNNPSENKPKNIQTHPQAIYTSRLFSFQNLPEPINSTDLSSFQYKPDAIPSTSTNHPISEGYDCQLSESDLNEIGQDDENNIE